VTLEEKAKKEVKEIFTRGWTVEKGNDKACRIFSLKAKEGKRQRADAKAD